MTELRSKFPACFDMPNMMRQLIALFVLVILLVSKYGLADIVQISPPSSVEQIRRAQEHQKDTMVDFLRRKNANDNQDKLGELLNLHNKLPIERANRESVISFPTTTTHSSLDTVKSQVQKPEFALEHWQQDEQPNNRPFVESISTKNVDPVTGAVSSSSMTTFHHEQSVPSSNYQHEEQAGLSSRSFSRSSSSSVQTSNQHHSGQAVGSSHIYKGPLESQDDQFAARNQHHEPESDIQHQHHDHAFDQGRSSIHYDSDHDSPAWSHSRTSLMDEDDLFRSDHDDNPHESHWPGTHHSPADEAIEESYIDRSDPFDPKYVNFKKEVKSRVGPNEVAHENREMKISNSLGGRSKSFKRQSSSFSSSFSSSSNGNGVDLHDNHHDHGEDRSQGNGFSPLHDRSHSFDAQEEPYGHFAFDPLGFQKRPRLTHSQSFHGERAFKPLPPLPTITQLPSLSNEMQSSFHNMKPMSSPSAGLGAWSSSPSHYSFSYSSGSHNDGFSQPPPKDFHSFEVGSSDDRMRSKLAKKARKHLKKKKDKLANRHQPY